MARLNAKGWELFYKWEQLYNNELERMRKELGDQEFVEGWCILDNYDCVKTLDDEVGLLIFGYDEHIDNYFNDWRGVWDDGFFKDASGKEYSLEEVERACLPYYEEY